MLAAAEQKRFELQREPRERLTKEQATPIQLTEELSSMTATTTATTEVAELQAKVKAAQDKAKRGTGTRISPCMKMVLDKLLQLK